MNSEIKINQGDEAVFKALFHKYYKSLVLFISKFNISQPESEDIAQEVFLKVWQRELSFPNEVAFKAYIYKSARNRVLNLLEHLSVRNRSMNDIIEKSQGAIAYPAIDDVKKPAFQGDE
ncbi:MAG: sigma-70 family RNA polymerase sigma factor [Bacteroidales bacterium]